MARDERKATKIPKAVLDAFAGVADIELNGEVNDAMLGAFLDQLAKARTKKGDIVVCVTTAGGDAEIVRRIVFEIENLQAEREAKVYFLGKSVVYSAGVSIMSALPNRNRYLTRDTELLIHGRQLTKTIELDGPIRASKPQVAALLAQIDTGMELEENGFRKLIAGSRLSLSEVIKKGTHNWYLKAEEAEKLNLVEGLLPAEPPKALGGETR